MWVRVHTSLIKELVTAQANRYHEWHSHVRRWSLSEWHKLEADLTRERGLWGPTKVYLKFSYTKIIEVERSV